MNSDFRKGVLLAAIAISLLLAAAIGMRRAEAAPIEHIQSWQEAVYLGTIEGDPAYYSSGQASPAEYHHALITATNQIAANQWVPIPSWLQPQVVSMVNPADFCPRYLWEYRDTPGEGYWPQTFADDNNRYDSIVVFDDFYGPVIYLWPSAGRMYQHPAGGYDRLIVCWTDQA